MKKKEDHIHGSRINCDECEDSTRDREVVLIFRPDKESDSLYVLGFPVLPQIITRIHATCFVSGDALRLARYETVIAAVVARKRPQEHNGFGICGLCDDSTRDKDVLAVSNPVDRSRGIHVHLDCFMNASLVDERTRTARQKLLGDRILDDLEFPKKP